MSQYGKLIEMVKEIQIVDYAQFCGYTLVPMGTYFSLKEHDSVRISKRKIYFGETAMEHLEVLLIL